MTLRGESSDFLNKNVRPRDYMQDRTKNEDEK